MNRLLFEKTGNGIWMSHLDLMRLFQRAFKRGGLHLKHTQGFSPRAMVSIALPLSVGVESVCEILDYELVGQELPFDEVKQRLNATLPAGVRVLDAYDSARKIKDLAYLDCAITMEYDAGIPAGCTAALEALFARDDVTVTKRGKNGPVEQNIIPMLRSFAAEPVSDRELRLNVTVCAQNPSLNPALILSAIEAHCPDCKPDFATIRRLEVRTPSGETFR